MDQHLKVIYLGEVEIQCQYALDATHQLTLAMNHLGTHPAAAREVHRAVHSFLTHGSNVSRILWPPNVMQGRGEASKAFSERRRATEERGRVLRDALGIEDESPLKSRALRNHLEHFDDRISEWHASSPHRNYARNVIGGPNTIVGIDPGDLMRWFDPTTNHYVFRGERYDLQDLVTAIDQLIPKAAAAVEAVDELLRSQRGRS